MQEGRGHLGVMRDLIAATGPIDARATGVADEAVQLIAVISALEETSVAPAIKRAVDRPGPRLSSARSPTAAPPISPSARPRWSARSSR